MTPSEQLQILKSIPQYPQRSKEWFDQRKDKLTSSDAGTVLGLNPYQTAVEVLFKKCGAGSEFTGNVATLHGQKYEEEAIQMYCKAMGKKNYDFGLIDFDAVYRETDLHTKERYPNGIRWLAGSTDGVAEDLSNKEALVLLEVKCPYRRKIVYGKCPEYYYPQVQLNMAILNLEKADFIEYKPSEGGSDLVLNIVRIQRDREWFDKNVVILEEFWNSVIYWRTQDITKHPEYYKYHKKGVDRVSKPSLFLEIVSDDEDS
jgi:putative phage-type endonuclease